MPRAACLLQAGRKAVDVIDVGKRIKGIRKKKGLTLQELSEKSGISATAISAIERNVSSPTVNTLAAIGRALGESLSSLLGEFDVAYVLTRAGARKRLASGIRNTDFESLASGAPGQRFHPMLCTLAPGAGSGDEFTSRRGDDFFYIIRGELIVEMGGEPLRLGEGDALYCPANAPCRWKNGFEGETRFLIVSAD